MPPIITQDPTNIMKGVPVNVYMGLAFNADGTVKNLQADGTVLIADHPNGIEFGFTQDGAELSQSSEREGLPVDQRTRPILPALTSKVAHMKFGMLEVLNFELLQKVVPGSVYHDEETHEGISDSNDLSIELHNVVAIAPANHDKTLFQVLIIYACSNIADFILKLSKEYHKMPVDFESENAGRADGKTWFAYITKPVAP